MLTSRSEGDTLYSQLWLYSQVCWGRLKVLTGNCFYRTDHWGGLSAKRKAIMCASRPVSMYKWPRYKVRVVMTLWWVANVTSLNPMRSSKRQPYNPRFGSNVFCSVKKKILQKWSRSVYIVVKKMQSPQAPGMRRVPAVSWLLEENNIIKTRVANEWKNMAHWQHYNTRRKFLRNRWN